MASKIIAIIGRPNVGKSTLYNRIVGQREAIVDDMPGVTRDRKYGDVEWTGKLFTIIDTGGFVPDSDDIFEKAIREQAEYAIEEADEVVMVVDATQGVLPLDSELASILRKSQKPVFLAVNKVDNASREMNVSEFHELALGDPIPISALTGRTIGDFLDIITKNISAEDEESTEKRLRIAVIGKPNVGKSSLVNALLGEKRQLVTDIPGTTRDPIDSILKYHGEEIILVDTAGLKRKSKISENIEFYSTLRTLRSIEHCNIAVIVLDASQPLDKQDIHIIDQTMQRKRPALLAINKWDLIEKETNTAKAYEQILTSKLGLWDFLPTVFISALTKQRVNKIIDMTKELHVEQNREITTSKLNDFLLKDIATYPPSNPSPKEIKIKYVTQIKTAPPLFAFFCNEPKLIQDSYKRFLENKIRQHFGFKGVPVGLVFRQK
jgi:GTP-binding protein